MTGVQTCALPIWGTSGETADDVLEALKNGKIKEEVPFELGAKNGIAKNYDEKGNITQIVYKFGKIVK